MNKLIKLELKKNSLKPYRLATLIISILILGFIYLMAAIPKIEPNDSDADLFSSFDFVIGLTMVVLMGIFSVMSAVISSKIVVDEYIGKKAILLFLYPISRKKILTAKIYLVFFYTFFSGLVVLSVFLITESLIDINPDVISMIIIVKSILSLICYSVISACCGVISLWFGMVRKSVTVPIVASCIISVLVCQIVAMSFFSELFLILILIFIIIFALIATYNLKHRVNVMEV